MEKHGLTVADIAAHTGGKTRGRKSGAATVARPATVAKYRHPKSGATWTGHGRAPAWIASARDRTKFLIDGSTTQAAAVPKTTTKTGNYVRGPQAAKYRDPRAARRGAVAVLRPHGWPAPRSFETPDCRRSRGCCSREVGSSQKGSREEDGDRQGGKEESRREKEQRGREDAIHQQGRGKEVPGEKSCREESGGKQDDEKSCRGAERRGSFDRSVLIPYRTIEAGLIWETCLALPGWLPVMHRCGSHFDSCSGAGDISSQLFSKIYLFLAKDKTG